MLQLGPRICPLDVSAALLACEPGARFLRLLRSRADCFWAGAIRFAATSTSSSHSRGVAALCEREQGSHATVGATSAAPALRARERECGLRCPQGT